MLTSSLHGTFRGNVDLVSAWFDTGVPFESLDPERPRFVEAPFGSFALYKVKDKVYCAQAFCPHLEGPLFQGTLSGDDISCPWHAWRFSLVTGARTDAAGRLLARGTRLRLCSVSRGPAGTILIALAN